MQFQRGQRGEVHHGNTEALQHQAVIAFVLLQPPTGHCRRQTGQADADIAGLNRYFNVFGSQPQQEGEAEKQNHHPGFQQRVAAHQPSEYWVLAFRFGLSGGLGSFR